MTSTHLTNPRGFHILARPAKESSPAHKGHNRPAVIAQQNLYFICLPNIGFFHYAYTLRDRAESVMGKLIASHRDMNAAANTKDLRAFIDWNFVRSPSNCKIRN